LLLLRRRAGLSRSSGEDITTSTRDLYYSIMQHLDGMKTIKSFGMQEENIRLFSIQSNQVADRYLGAVESYANVKLLFDVGTVVVLAVLVLVLIEVIKLPTASLLLLIYLFVRMIPQFSLVQHSYQYFINTIPAFGNVMNLENQCLENPDIPRSGEKVIFEEMISLEDVSFSYRGEDHFTMKDFNLSILAGRTVAIAGPSGAGKSTVADLVMGLIQPENGRILVDGLPVVPGSWRGQVGYVAQETFLFNETVRYNLLLARPDVEEKDLLDALELAAAQGFVEKLPDGLDTVIGDRGVRLSGGERQRLALARALLRKPALLILDEATSNLDSENEKRILDSVESLHGDMTILVIAHRLSTISSADSIYLMEEGHIVESGTWDELLSLDDGSFKRVWKAQSIKED
jgi:ATP-binding cassette, subfamily C, bacterial